MKKFALLALGFATMQVAPAALLAHWNFNTLTSTGASPANWNQTAYASASGSASLNLAGWTTAPGSASNLPGVGNQPGLTMNLVSPDVAGRSLQLFGGIGTAASPIVNNGATATFQFSTAGFIDPVISFATNRTASGFTNVAVAVSIDGTNFTNVGGYGPPTTATVVTLNFASVDVLDNTPTAYVRFTFTGATAASGNHRLDNIQIQAVPEPMTLSVLALGTAWVTRRRRVNR